MTNQEVFHPVGLEGKEWAGWGWEECVLGRREEAGSELHPVLIGESRATKWGGRRGDEGNPACKDQCLLISKKPEDLPK